MSYLSQNNALKVLRVSSLPITGEDGNLYLNTTAKTLHLWEKNTSSFYSVLKTSDFVYDYYAKYSDIVIGSYDNVTRNIIVLIDETDGNVMNTYQSVNGILKKNLGKSAYQVALDNGFVGTESEWVNQLNTQVAIATAQATIATNKANEAKTVGFQGTWNASTNSPTLTTTPNSGFVDGAYYDVVVAGTQSITGISVTFGIGDQVKKVGTSWVRVPSSSRIDNLGDTSIISPVDDDILQRDGASGLWKNRQPPVVKHNNPDISFAIVDAQQKIIAYFDLLGKFYADVNLSTNNVNTLSIADNAVTKQKLETSLQNLLTLLSGTQSISDLQGDGYYITDSSNKKLLEIGLDGKIKGLFDFSLSPIQSTDLSSTVTSLFHQSYSFNQDFQEFCYTILDSAGRIIFGLRPDGTSTLPTQIQANSVGLIELKQEVKDRLLPAKRLVCFGDSLTQGAGGGGNTYPVVLAGLLSSYAVINCGVGGETVGGISARLGGVPCLITASFTLPADTSVVEISSTTNVRLKNVLNANITPLLQGAGNSVNPCYVEGVECTLSWNGTQYFIQRNVSTTNSLAIKANTPLVFYGNKAYRDSDILILFMGQNGGYNGNTDEFIKYVDACTKYNRKSNFIVVGLHTGTPTSRAELETRCLLEYGIKYINLREYISGNAMYDLGLTPTTDDLIAMTNGTFPPSLWASPTDSIHGNSNFYTAVGHKIYSRILELGY